MLYNMKKMFLSALILVVLDYFYLSSVSPFFNKLIKSIQGSKINLHLGSAILDYMFIILGLNYFVIQKNGTIEEAFMLGFTTYGVFEATNMAIFNKWNLSKYAIIDIIWGGILYSTTAYLTKRFYKFI